MIQVHRPEKPYTEIVPMYSDDSSVEDDSDYIGNIPREWYDDLPHVGYDLNGNPVFREDPSGKKDRLDDFIARTDDPNSWRTIYDERTGREIVLTDEDLRLLKCVASGGSLDPQEDQDFTASALKLCKVDSLYGDKPEPKRRFIPSKHEHRRIVKLAHAIRAGRISTEPPKLKDDHYVDLWSNVGENTNKISARHIQFRPKVLPTHHLSYNPPKEYIEEDHETYSTLRAVPMYKKYIKEVYDRYFDMLIIPRKRLCAKPTIDPDSLLTEYPDPQTLTPFPNTYAFSYSRHNYPITCLSIHPAGKYIACGTLDGCVFVFDIFTTRCLQKWFLGTDLLKSSSVTGIDANPEIQNQNKRSNKVESLDYESEVDHAVRCIAWNPQEDVCILTVGISNRILMLMPTFLTGKVVENTNAIISIAFRAPVESTKASNNGNTANNNANIIDGDDTQKNSSSQAESVSNTFKDKKISWVKPSLSEKEAGHLLHILLPTVITHISWHSKGNYFLSTSRSTSGSAVIIHQLTTHKSQTPFRKLGGIVRSAIFHPNLPQLLLATQNSVRIYDLAAKKTEKRLNPGSTVSCVSIHPGGDHVVVGGYDNTVSWFDLELGSSPYKKLSHHKAPVRNAEFHPTRPLFSSSCSSGSLYVFHVTVYSDITQYPLLVPLKKLTHSESGCDIHACLFHPTLPWLFSAGSDGRICLYTDIH